MFHIHDDTARYITSAPTLLDALTLIEWLNAFTGERYEVAQSS